MTIKIAYMEGFHEEKYQIANVIVARNSNLNIIVKNYIKENCICDCSKTGHGGNYC